MTEAINQVEPDRLLLHFAVRPLELAEGEDAGVSRQRRTLGLALRSPQSPSLYLPPESTHRTLRQP
jgi:hypothetical protein